MNINSDCMACGMCLEICPVGAIGIKSSSGHAQSYIDQEKCVNCKKCLNDFECPAMAIELNPN